MIKAPKMGEGWVEMYASIMVVSKLVTKLCRNGNVKLFYWSCHHKITKVKVQTLFIVILIFKFVIRLLFSQKIYLLTAKRLDKCFSWKTKVG